MVKSTVDSAPTLTVLKAVDSPLTPFRVENRRAKPIIIKNVADKGNKFFSQ